MEVLIWECNKPEWNLGLRWKRNPFFSYEKKNDSWKKKFQGTDRCERQQRTKGEKKDMKIFDGSYVADNI